VARDQVRHARAWWITVLSDQRKFHPALSSRPEMPLCRDRLPFNKTAAAAIVGGGESGNGARGVIA